MTGVVAGRALICYGAGAERMDGATWADVHGDGLVHQSRDDDQPGAAKRSGAASPAVGVLPDRHTDLVGDHQGFTVALPGYDVAEVDAMLERIRKAVVSTDRELRASVRGALNHPALRVSLRGYDRIEVDDYLRRAIDRLA